jgi:hypothetical protein
MPGVFILSELILRLKTPYSSHAHLNQTLKAYMKPLFKETLQSKTQTSILHGKRLLIREYRPNMCIRTYAHIATMQD